MPDKEKKPAPHLGHRKRIKARYLTRGLLALDDKDLLELLLSYAIPRKDVYGLASELVQKFGSAKEVLRASCEELESAGRLSEHTIVLLKLVYDLMTKDFRFIEFRREKLTSVLQTAQYCHRILGDFPEEAVIELFLDNDNVVTDVTKVSYGSGESALLPIDLMVANALRHNVRRIIIAHNHPSGIAKPSAADVYATEELKKALASHGLELTEHVIVTKGACSLLMHHQTIPMSEQGALLSFVNRDI